MPEWSKGSGLGPDVFSHSRVQTPQHAFFLVCCDLFFIIYCMFRSILHLPSKQQRLIRYYSRSVPVLMDSVSARFQEIPRPKDYLSWYSCGPTVYDSSHVGHARTYVQIDIIQRLLSKQLGYNVYNALGITNIDDKIINKSKETKIPWKEIADKYEGEYFNDMDKLNVQRPKSIIRVSDTIPDIIDYIRVLLDKQVAYYTSNGVYFDTQSEHYNYSKLVAPIDDTEAQSRIASDNEKKHPRDFALWKCTNEQVNQIKIILLIMIIV